MRSPRGVPLAFSGSDVPDGSRLLVHSCEDCACPVSHVESDLPPPVLPSGPLSRARDVLAIPLDDEHHALFGPHGNGGVVVVNEAAHSLLDDLAEPTCLSDLVAAGHDADEADAVLTRLFGADLVHPCGVEPAPRFRRSRELTVWMHVTNACNLACPYCYVNKSREAMDEATATETVDALVKSAVGHGFTAIRLKYAGGEASLNADVLFALHDHARNRCAAAGLTLSAVLLSNGVAISDRLARELVARQIAVMVSLDGIGAAHDAQRPTLNGRPSFAMVQRSLDRLRAAGAAPHLSITITGRNVADVAPVVRFALEREITFSFNFFRDNDCSAGVADLGYEEQAMIDGLRARSPSSRRCSRRGVCSGRCWTAGSCSNRGRRHVGSATITSSSTSTAGSRSATWSWATTLGDVRQIDPVQAVRADGAPIRNLLVEDKAGCRDCTWRHWCSGGCSVATFAATGRFDLRSPNCRIYKTIYPEAVRLEGLRLLAYARA